MNANELKEKNAEELKSEMMALLRQQFNLRMQQGTGQLTQSHLLKNVRRDIARVKTIMKQKAGV